MENQGEVLSVEEGREPKEDDSTYSMDELLEESYAYKPFQRGDIVKGVIVSASPTEILIDIGSKTEGLVSSRELERMGPEAIERLKMGDEVPAYVLNPEDKNGNVILSLSRAQLEKDWQTAQEMFEVEECFETTVSGYNKGGLIVRLGKVRGFIPASQLAPSYHRSQEEPQSNEEYWARMVGQQLQLKIIELDRRRNRLILSERAAMREWRKQQKQSLLNELQEGDIRRGRVSSLCNFGAFIDLGGADGLVHLSELSWGRVSHPKEVLRIGDEVDVYVLNVDWDKRRIGLSIKRLQPEPWSLVPEKYSVGQLVQGTITKLANFGAFARLDNDEIEGLIHISELSEDPIAHPKEVLREGDVVTLRIIRIDADRRRMGLSLKRVEEGEYIDLDWREGHVSDLARGEAELEEPRAEYELSPEVEEIAAEEIAAPYEATLEAEAQAESTQEAGLQEGAEIETQAEEALSSEIEEEIGLEEIATPYEATLEAEAQAESTQEAGRREEAEIETQAEEALRSEVEGEIELEVKAP
jgi:small subunit ribosomal protein S1